MKKLMLVVAMAACALPAYGQNGRVELAGFGRWTSFTRDRPIKNAFGPGGGLSIYLFDRLRLSADASYTKSDSVEFVPFHARLVYEQPIGSAVRLMIGSGYVHNSYTHSRANDQGIADVVGIKLRVSPALNLFVQGTHDWMDSHLNDAVISYVQVRDTIHIQFDTYNDINLGVEAGLAYRFGAKRQAPPVAVAPPPPPPPVAEQQPAQAPPPPPAPAAAPVSLNEAPAPPKYAILVPLFFDFNKANLRADQQAQADAMVGLLKNNPDAQVTIIGHTDERGSASYNMKLGLRRAESAKTYMIANGIAASRLTTMSKGESEPIDPGHDETAWAKNRRVEFKVKGDMPLKVVTAQ